MPSPRMLYAPSGADPLSTIYVDGTEEGFRSLSHWPGNTTPSTLKRDLSTGIALAWAALDARERARVLGDFEHVANNHYDTDGALSLFAVLRPDEALPRADLMQRAAATGDFGTWNGPDALAVELTVMALPGHPHSPVTHAESDSSDTRREAAYRWCMEHLDEVLDDPYRWQALWQERHEQVVDDIQRVDAGEGLTVERFPDEDLAVVHSERELTRLGLHQAAGDLYRVLLTRRGEAGTRYRFFYRDESWFELPEREVLPRRALDLAAEHLGRLEGPLVPPTCWWSTGLRMPVGQLGFSDPALAGDGFSEDPHLGSFAPSSQGLEAVLDVLRAALRGD